MTKHKKRFVRWHCADCWVAVVMDDDGNESLEWR